MATFIKTGLWEKAAKGFKGWLNLDELVRNISSAVTLTDDELSTIHQANDPDVNNVFATMGDLLAVQWGTYNKPYKSYTCLLSQTTISSTSGVLVPGKVYNIPVVLSDDDFTNVGYVEDGEDFMATDTTPTKWTNSTIVDNQTDSAPVAVELNNELGTVTWSRFYTGTYLLTSDGLFTEDKTIPIDDIYADQESNLYMINWIDVNTIMLITSASIDIETPADGLLEKRYINIEVYN